MEEETERGMGTPLTDEERKKLINALKNYQGYDRELRKLVHEAADEIERLVDIKERYKKLSKYLCTIIREKLNELEEINND